MRRVPFLLVGIAVASATLLAQTPANPSFEVASVKPNTGSDGNIPFEPTPPDGIRLVNHPLESIIRYAYGVQPFRVVGLPGWTHSERFDIAAKASSPITERERLEMMRSLLADRFKVKAHFDSREQTVYVLRSVRAGSALGSGLTPRPDCATKPCSGSGSGSRVAGRIILRGTTLDRLATGMLSLMLDHVVRTESGVDRAFDIQLSWRPDTADANDSRPSLFTAVEEQLGMKLVPERGQVEVLVIDHVERPTEN